MGGQGHKWIKRREEDLKGWDGEGRLGSGSYRGPFPIYGIIDDPFFCNVVHARERGVIWHALINAISYSGGGGGRR